MALTDAEQRELDELEYKTLMAKHRGDPETAALLESSAVSEGPADVPAADRMLIQNLSNSPEAGAEYLKSKGYDAKVYGSEIVIKDKSTGKIKQLDPNDLEWKDATDILYDVPAGVIQAGATAVGGVYGGGIPGASAASGASGMALEALRQKLGQYAGLPQDVNAQQVGIAGLAGVASPALLGSGATSNQIAKRALTTGASEAELANANRSLVTRGVENAFPTVASASSGIPKSAIKTYINRKPEVDALIEMGPQASYNKAEEVYNKVKDHFFSKKNEVGKALETQITGSPNLIRRDAIFEPMENRLSALVNSEASLTPNGQAEIQAIRDEIDGMKEGLPEFISPKTAWQIQDQLKVKSNFNNISGTFQSRHGKNATGAEKIFSDAAGDSYRVVNKELENAAGASGLKKEYADLSKLQDRLQKYFKDPETTERTLLHLDKPSKGAARNTVDSLEKMTGDSGVRDSANLLESYSYFQNPEMLPISGAGTTSTSRTLGLSSIFEVAGGLAGPKGAQMGKGIGSVLGGGKAVKGAVTAGKFLSKKVGNAPALVSPWVQKGLGESYQDYLLNQNKDNQ